MGKIIDISRRFSFLQVQKRLERVREIQEQRDTLNQRLTKEASGYNDILVMEQTFDPPLMGKLTPETWNFVPFNQMRSIKDRYPNVEMLRVEMRYSEKYCPINGYQGNLEFVFVFNPKHYNYRFSWDFFDFSTEGKDHKVFERTGIEKFGFVFDTYDDFEKFQSFVNSSSDKRNDEIS